MSVFIMCWIIAGLVLVMAKMKEDGENFGLHCSWTLIDILKDIVTILIAIFIVVIFWPVLVPLWMINERHK